MNRIDSRRRQLLSLGTHALGWWSLGALAGCGGGGGDAGTDAPTPPPPAVAELQGAGLAAAGVPGAPVDAARRLATLQTVRERTAQLAAGGVRVDAVALAQTLLGLTTLQRVGLSGRMDNLWAVFTDGSALVVPNNLAPVAVAPAGATGPGPRSDTKAAQALRRAAAAPGSDLPAVLTAAQYRQLDMFGAVPLASGVDSVHLSGDFVGPDTLPALRRMAVGRGFVLPDVQLQQAPDGGLDNGIEGLARVADDGVFFVTACGAQAGPDDQPRSVICTATAADAATLARYADEITSGLIVPCVGWRGVGGAWEPYAALAITADFVRVRGWSFPANSLGILNVSGGGALADWHGALGAAGLANLVAWERAVPWPRLLGLADDLIQLSLATNRFASRTLPQDDTPRLRAYGVGPSLQYLEQRGVAAGAIVYLPSSSPDHFAGTLLPTLDYALFDEERDAIELVGQFGASADTAAGRPAIRTATAPGQPYALPELQQAADGPLRADDALPGPNWSGNLLSTTVPDSLLQQGGWLQVFNGGRAGNAVPVTHWAIVLRATTTVDALTLTIDITLHLRADVHGWRLEPDGEPRNGIASTPLSTMTRSFATWQAGGSASRSNGTTRTTVDWSGGGDIVNETLMPRRVTLAGLMDWPTRRLTMPQLQVLAQATFTQRRVVERFDSNGELLSRSETVTPEPVELLAFDAGDGAFALRFDEQWKLQAGGFELPPQPSDALPGSPQAQRRTRLAWAAVDPDFPPGETYGGT